MKDFDIGGMDLDLDLDLDLDFNLSLGMDAEEKDMPASTGNLETDFQEELSDAAKAIKAYYKQSYARQKQITDSGYYFCVCFQTAEQCRDFLAATGWEKGQEGARFLNGIDLARRMGVKLERSTQRPKRTPPRPRFIDQALELETCADVVNAKQLSEPALRRQIAARGLNAQAEEQAPADRRPSPKQRARR